MMIFSAPESDGRLDRRDDRPEMPVRNIGLAETGFHAPETTGSNNRFIAHLDRSLSNLTKGVMVRRSSQQRVNRKLFPATVLLCPAGFGQSEEKPHLQ